jgi:hypothetical protein
VFKRILRAVWLGFCCLLEALWGVVVEVSRENNKFTLFLFDIMTPAFLREEQKKKRSTEWEDGVAVFSKLPHQEVKTNEGGKQLKVKINGRSY